MRRFRTSLLGLALAALAVAQSGSQLVTPEVRRVGSRLACLCGSCKNTVGDCAMLECHYSKPARIKIIAMQKEGRSDDEIVAQFVKDEGRRALAAPPAEGFHLLAWIMPFAVIALGLAVIWWFVRRLSAKPQTVPPVDEKTLGRYHEQIEKDLAQLD
jgi:cytochrome c-type biogenesis protein CcmH/NrfF